MRFDVAEASAGSRHGASGPAPGAKRRDPWSADYPTGGGASYDGRMSHEPPPSRRADPAAPAGADDASPVRAGAGPSPVPATSRARLRSSLREFVVIVAGVLVALAAQAWWEGRERRDVEQDYLEQLRSDARENLERLRSAIVEDSLGGAAADSAMLAMAGRIDASAGQIALWIARLGQASDFQPVTGAHRALQETGDLRFIRDDSVRHALITYATSLDRETARLEQLRGAVLESVPMLARALPSMRLIFAAGLDTSAVSLERLREDPDVSVAVFTFQAALENRLSGLRRMRAATGRLLETLAPRGS